MQRINCKIYGQTKSINSSIIRVFFFSLFFFFLHFCYLRTTQYYSMKDNRETQQKVPKGGILITLSLDSSSTTSIISGMSTEFHRIHSDYYILRVDSVSFSAILRQNMSFIYFLFCAGYIVSLFKLHAILANYQQLMSASYDVNMNLLGC